MPKQLEFGQRVTTRQLGTPAVGTLDGFIKAEPYASESFPDFDYAEWDRCYPLWRNGYLAFVRLDEKCDCGGLIFIHPAEDVVPFDDDFVEGMGKGLISREAAA